MTLTNHDLMARIRAAADQEAAYLAAHAAFGVRALDAQPGRTAFGQEMGQHLLDVRGALCPGAFLIAADAALGSAIATQLPEGRSVMSLTIHAHFVTLDPGAAREFSIRAESVHVGERSGYSVGTVTDDCGRTVAHISSQCGYAQAARIAGPPTPVPPFDWTGEPGAARDGLAPIAVRRSGARLAGSTDDEVTVAARATPELRNSRGDLQGGVLGLLAEQALTACLIHSSPPLARAATMELDVSYVRPVGPDQPGVEVTARIQHAGRRFAVAQATCRDTSGRVVMSAVGSRYAG